MASPIQKNSTPLSSIFDPYTQGAKAAATGLYENGNDLCNLYAPLSVGSAAAATGIRKNGADLNTIFAALGTAQYPLGCNGQTFTGAVTPSGSDPGGNDLSFSFSFSSASAWAITGFAESGGVQGGTFSSNFSGPTASGALNSGATQAQIASTYLGAAGDTGPAKTITNNYATKAAITAGTAFYFQQFTPNGVTHQSTYSVQVTLYNAAGAVLSTTTFTVQLRSA